MGYQFKNKFKIPGDLSKPLILAIVLKRGINDPYFLNFTMDTLRSFKGCGAKGMYRQMSGNHKTICCPL